MKKIPKYRRPDPKRYNVEMIRDFLDHLRWELVASQTESMQKVGDTTLNPELVDQLKKYSGKYGTPLLPVIAIRTDPGLSQDELTAAGDEMRKKQLAEQTAQLECLDALGELFKKVFWTIDHVYERGSIPQFVFDLRKKRGDE